MTNNWNEFIYQIVWITFLSSGILIILFLAQILIRWILVKISLNRARTKQARLNKNTVVSENATQAPREFHPTLEGVEQNGHISQNGHIPIHQNHSLHSTLKESRISETEQAQLKEIIQDIKNNQTKQDHSSPILTMWEKLLKLLDDMHIHKALLCKKDVQFSVCHYHNFYIDNLLYIEKKLNHGNGKLKNLMLDIVQKQKRICLTGKVSLSSDCHFLFEDSEKGHFNEIYLLPFKIANIPYILVLIHHKTHEPVSKDHLNKFLTLLSELNNAKHSIV